MFAFVLPNLPACPALPVNSMITDKALHDQSPITVTHETAGFFKKTTMFQHCHSNYHPEAKSEDRSPNPVAPNL